MATLRLSTPPWRAKKSQTLHRNPCESCNHPWESMKNHSLLFHVNLVIFVLVGGFNLPLWKIWENVNWNDFSIPNLYGEKTCSSHHQADDIYIYTYIYPNKWPCSYGFPMVSYGNQPMMCIFLWFSLVSEPLFNQPSPWRPYGPAMIKRWRWETRLSMEVSQWERNICTLL